VAKHDKTQVVGGYAVYPRKMSSRELTEVGTSYLYDGKVRRVVASSRVLTTANGWGCYRLLTLRTAEGVETKVACTALRREGRRAGGCLDLGITSARRLGFGDWEVGFACDCHVTVSRCELYADGKVCKAHTDVLAHAVERSAAW